MSLQDMTIVFNKKWIKMDRKQKKMREIQVIIICNDEYKFWIIIYMSIEEIFFIYGDQINWAEFWTDQHKSK